MSDKQSSDSDGIPKIYDMEGYKKWTPLISGYLARKQCADTTYPLYVQPVLVLPQVAAPLRAASDLAATAAHTVALAKYDSIQQQSYGILLAAIQEFKLLYDFVFEQDELLQAPKLNGTILWTLIARFHLENGSDSMMSIIDTKIQKCRLANFPNVAALISNMDELYHVQSAGFRHTSAQKKLQLKVACKKSIFETYLDVHYDNMNYAQLCAKLKNHAQTKQAENDANGMKFEAHIAQDKQQEESAAEHVVHYADNRGILKQQYHPRWEEQRQHPQEYKRHSRRSYSRSPSRETHFNKRERGRSPSPHGSYRGQGGRQDSPNSGRESHSPGRDKRAGTDRRVFRISDTAKEWRTGGSAYGGDRRSPSPHGRSSHYGRQQGSDGGAYQQPSGPQCFKCKGWGHVKAVCPNK
jgi:hypothetical protein